MRILTLLTLLLLLSCSSKEEQLTKEEQFEINTFVSHLTASIQNLEYDFLRNAWSHEVFKQRISDEMEADATAFKYIYDEKIKVEVQIANNDLINKQKYSNGSIKYLTTEFFRNHAEVSYLLFFDGSFKLIKYRIEKYGQKLVLSDYFMITQNVWASEYMSNIAMVNKRYRNRSKKRIEANENFNLYRQYIEHGDSSSALYYLNQIPKTHHIGNYLSLLKIRCAAGINDTVFVETLLTESEGNNSLYLDYLTAYYIGDTLELNKMYMFLKNEHKVPEEDLTRIREDELIWQ
ncbi:hypothetical protein [Halocola ammonii]